MSTQKKPVSLSLSQDDAFRFADALNEVPTLLNHAEDIFRFFVEARDCGLSLDSPGCRSLFEMCALGFETEALKKGETLSGLEGDLRALGAEMMQMDIHRERADADQS